MELLRPDVATELGVGVVHQIPVFVPSLSITENLLLGFPHANRKLGLIDWASEHRSARSTLAAVGLDLDPAQPIENISPHQRQLVAVARALKYRLKVLILDEVTAPLSEPEVRMLQERVRPLRDSGVAIIYVSHRLDEIFEIADRVTIMRDGKHISTCGIAELTYDTLVEGIVGPQARNAVAVRPPMTVSRDRKPILSVRGLSDAKLKDITFDLHPGEILGIAGLSGSGRSRLLHMLFATRPNYGGSLLLDGREVAFAGPHDALAQGIGMVTEDRLEDGFVPSFPIWKNISLPWPGLFSRWTFLNLTRERRVASEKAHALNVRMASPDSLITELSGGNQQKVIFSRWITVIVVSSELEELELLVDRVLLLKNGRVLEEMGHGKISKETILSKLL